MSQCHNVEALSNYSLMGGGTDMNREIDVNLLIQAYQERISELEKELVLYKAVIKQNDLQNSMAYQEVEKDELETSKSS